MTDKTKIHYCDMGPWPYYVGFTTDKDAFASEVKRLGIDDKDVGFIKKSWSNATTHEFTKNGGAKISIICCEPFSSRKCDKEQYASLIAHEVVHVLQSMRGSLGDLGHEAEAYLLQSILQECLQIAWKTGKENRKVPESG